MRGVAIEIVFETHSTTEDNERGIATGWLAGRLSDGGRAQARALGLRRRDDGIDAIFTSDLSRAVETAAVAFGETDIPILADWRLRECDYGERNGTPVAWFRGHRAEYIDRTRTPEGRAGARPRCGWADSSRTYRFDGRDVASW